MREVRGNCGEDMVASAAAQEKVRYCAMSGIITPVPTRRPTDDFQLVIVAVTYNITASVGEPLHYVEMTRSSGPMHCVGVVPLLAGVHIEPTLQEKIDDSHVSVLCRRMQESPLVRRDTEMQSLWM